MHMGRIGLRADDRLPDGDDRHRLAMHRRGPAVPVDRRLRGPQLSNLLRRWCRGVRRCGLFVHRLMWARDWLVSGASDEHRRLYAARRRRRPAVQLVERRLRAGQRVPERDEQRHHAGVLLHDGWRGEPSVLVDGIVLGACVQQPRCRHHRDGLHDGVAGWKQRLRLYRCVRVRGGGLRYER